MKSLTACFSVAILGLLFCTPASATTVDLDNPAALEAFIDGVVKPLMKNNNSPSGTVAIASNGRLVFAKGYGFEDIETQKPVDAYTTLFRPGSVSKLFTWVSVMQLVEQKQLDLDADVNSYLEEFKIKPAFDTPITLRHIMTHTAGFEDGGLGYLIIKDESKVLTLRESMERYQPARINPPGTHTAYSNYATALAGLIVENVSGVPFNDYVKQNIFDPLGMANASFSEPLPAGLAENMAKSYKVDSGAFVEQPFEIIANFAPAGSLSATSTDMIRFAQAILNGGELEGHRILNSDTVEQMLTRNFTHDDRLMGMLLGFYEGDYNGNRVIGHGGDTEWFHSFLGLDRDNGLALFVSFGGPGGSPVRSALTPALYDELSPRAEAPPVPQEGFTESAGQFAGDYGFWRTNFSTIEKAFRMGSSVQVAPTKDDTLVISFAGNAKQYVQVEKNLFRELDPNIALIPGISPRLLAFQQNDEGHITGFVMDGLPFMSLRKLPVTDTAAFNGSLLGLSLIIFIAVCLRRLYQRKAIALLPADDKVALNAALYTAVAHLLVAVCGGVVVSVVMDSLMSGFPLVFKLWLSLPILATLLSAYLVYRTVEVWRHGRLAGVWSRLRYSTVTLGAILMSWFYWYWNILGFQYLE